jgi:hypothetical protein
MAYGGLKEPDVCTKCVLFDLLGEGEIRCASHTIRIDNVSAAMGDVIEVFCPRANGLVQP